MSKLRRYETGVGEAIDTAFRRLLGPVGADEAAALRMRIDVHERDDAYEVKADLPGVRKEDIQVNIDGKVVQIDAEIHHESQTQDESKKLVRSERYHGRLSRTFSLARDVDEARTVARYADGVLTLELPKKAGESARKIEVH
jgi:HSP20 family protein